MPRIINALGQHELSTNLWGLSARRRRVPVESSEVEGDKRRWLDFDDI